MIDLELVTTNKISIFWVKFYASGNEARKIWCSPKNSENHVTPPFVQKHDMINKK